MLDRPSPAAHEVSLPEQQATFAILYGSDDRPSSWLRAGEAFGAGCLAMAEAAMPILALTDAIEDPDARENVRRLLPGPGCPYLILRVGAPDAAQAA